MSENKPLQVYRGRILSASDSQITTAPTRMPSLRYLLNCSRQSLYDLEHEAGMGASHRPEGDCRSSPLADRESRRAATGDGPTVDVRPLEELPGQVEITGSKMGLDALLGPEDEKK